MTFDLQTLVYTYKIEKYSLRQLAMPVRMINSRILIDSIFSRKCFCSCHSTLINPHCFSSRQWLRLVERTSIIAFHELGEVYKSWRTRARIRKQEASLRAVLRIFRFLFYFYFSLFLSSRGETERAGTFHANFTVQEIPFRARDRQRAVALRRFPR